MKDLRQKAILANVKISQWTAHKYDKNVSEEIEKKHNTRNAGRYNKILIAEDELKKIQKAANSARRFLYEQTLPWGDNGDRLLPATNYMEFLVEFSNYKSDFEGAVKNFILQYPALKDEARKRLNGMFREADYPSIADMKSKFSMEHSFMPISDTKDFRLEVDAEEVEALKGHIEQEIQSRITQSTMHIWKRIKEAVGHMVAKLSEDDPVFKDSLVNNIHDLVEVLPRLNFTNDPDIFHTIESMKELLVAPDLLRNDKALQHEKATEAKAIVDKIADFLGMD